MIMKSVLQRITCVVMIACVSACSPSHDAPIDAKALAADQQALRHMKEVEWPKAYREQDTVLLDRLLNDDFEMIEADGTVSNKAAELAWIKKNEWKVDSFRYDIERIHVWPNRTAIISGTGHMISDRSETIYTSSNVFIKTDSIWQAISSHVSGVKEVPRQ